MKDDDDNNTNNNFDDNHYNNKNYFLLCYYYSYYYFNTKLGNYVQISLIVEGEVKSFYFVCENIVISILFFSFFFNK